MNDKSCKVCCICTLVIAVFVVVAVCVAVIVAASQSNDDGTQSQSAEVSYNLHPNPDDPVILSAETPDGDLISMLGNKSASGEPQAIDEFIIENQQNEDELTFVYMNNGDGSIESGEDNDGVHIDFIWDENLTTVYTSVLLNNGSQQLSIAVNLTEPLGENFTDFDIDSDIPPFKRSLNNNGYQVHQPKNSARSKTTAKRQSDTQESAHASVFVSVESCNGPESNARVFADVLLDYEQDSGNYESKAKYWGARSSIPGEYEVRIPTSKASMIGEKLGNICDKINMVLGKVCGFYSKANKVTKSWTGHNVESLLCFKLQFALRLAFPTLGLFSTYRLCRKIFKPLITYCNKADEDLIPGIDNTSPVDLICETLPIVDNGIDLFREKDIFFTPTAIIPPGNHIQATGQVLSLQPGVSAVLQRFTISDQGQLRITDFSVIPFDPLPGENYRVIVTYDCYASSAFSVNMSIVGTDGYSDYNVCYTGPTCVLYVPGAEALVRDDVEIYIENDQIAISRMVVVIF